MIRYYHYRKLSKYAQKAYLKIVAAIKSYSANVTIDTVTNLQNVMDAVKDDNPHFFYVNWGRCLYSSQIMTSKTILKFAYNMPSVQAKYYLRSIEQLALSLKGNSEYNTICNVHDYLAKTVTYNQQVIKSREYYYRPNDHMVIGPIFDKMGVCEGIARAFQLLLKILKIDCTYMSGYIDLDNRKACHAWNIVFLEGRAKKIDVTWDLDKDKPSHKYFMTPLNYF